MNREAMIGILHPYFASERRHDLGRELERFRHGIPEDVYVVLVVGGSVAAAWVDAASDIFNSTVQAHPRLAGRRVRLLNYAHPSHKQPQQLTKVAYLLSLPWVEKIYRL